MSPQKCLFLSTLRFLSLDRPMMSWQQNSMGFWLILGGCNNCLRRRITSALFSSMLYFHCLAWFSAVLNSTDVLVFLMSLVKILLSGNSSSTRIIRHTSELFVMYMLAVVSSVPSGNFETTDRKWRWWFNRFGVGISSVCCSRKSCTTCYFCLPGGAGSLSTFEKLSIRFSSIVVIRVISYRA